MEQTTISGEPASAYERGLSVVIITLLVAASLATLPFHRAAFGVARWFIPTFSGATGTADLLSAVLLFGLYRIDGRRLVLVAATAYLVDALLIVPYTLTFPNVVSATGYLGNQQSAIWLWVVWHLSFPALLLFGLLRGRGIDDDRRRARCIAIAFAGAALFATACAFAATLGHRALPVLVRADAFVDRFAWLALLAALVNFSCAIAFAVRGEVRSALGLWFTMATIVSGLDATLNSFALSRYSSAWYVGKIETFLTASVVVVSLLIAFCVRYSRSIAVVAELRAAVAQSESLQVRLAREQEIALALQRVSLPRTLPRVPGVELCAAYRPAIGDLQIGGDWYDVFETADERLVITIGDVSGKGLAASLVMGHVRQSLRHAAYLDANPGAMLALADRALLAEDPEKMVTAFVGVLDRGGVLEWASAGHPCPMLRQPGRAVEELYAPGLPLGLRAGMTADVRRTILRPGALLVMYTDGLVESNRDYVAGAERLARDIATYDYSPERDFAADLYDRIVANGAQDDVAIVTLAFAGAAADVTDTVTMRFSFDDQRQDDAVA